jgi:hypothetical protein
MPYVVTTRQPCPEGHTEPVMQGDGHGWDGTSYHTPPCATCDDRCEVIVSRRAVATLEEAQRAAAEITLPYALTVQPAEDKAMSAACSAITESGGTVGPLPDGTVIEVEPTTLARLCADLYEDLSDYGDDEPIKRWNAKQAS